MRAGWTYESLLSIRSLLINGDIQNNATSPSHTLNHFLCQRLATTGEVASLDNIDKDLNTILAKILPKVRLSCLYNLRCRSRLQDVCLQVVEMRARSRRSRIVDSV